METKNSTIKNILIIAVAIIFIAGVYYVFSDKSDKSKNINTETEQTSSTTPKTEVGVKATGNYKIEQVSMGDTIPKPIPDLNRKTVTYSGYKVSPETFSAAENKIKSLQDELKKNLVSPNSWMDLGIYQKMAGDFDGAVLSWKYVGKLSPTDYISLGNLGNLYTYFMNDKAVGESYYKQAISKNPKQNYIYIQFAEVYRDVFKDNTKALEVINKGLENIPNDQGLIQMKSTLN